MEEKIKEIKADLERIKLQKEVCQMEQKALTTFAEMKKIELAIVEHQSEVAKNYPQEYAKFKQAVSDMQMFMNRPDLRDMQENIAIWQKTLAMYQDTLKDYQSFYQKYQDMYGRDLEATSTRQKELQDNLKRALIQEIIPLVYPNITPELKPIVENWFIDKSIPELEDIKRLFLNEKLANEGNPRV